MTEPTRLAAHLSADRALDELQTRRDDLLARIEAEDLLPEWCWAPMTETISRLTDLGDDFAWVIVSYLSSVVVRGPAMFNPAAQQLAINAEADTVVCRCGADAPADPLVRRGGRLVRTARCVRCGLDLVVYDEEAHDDDTLRSRGMV